MASASAASGSQRLRCLIAGRPVEDEQLVGVAQLRGRVAEALQRQAGSRRRRSAPRPPRRPAARRAARRRPGEDGRLEDLRARSPPSAGTRAGPGPRVKPERLGQRRAADVALEQRRPPARRGGGRGEAEGDARACLLAAGDQHRPAVPELPSRAPSASRSPRRSAPGRAPPGTGRRDLRQDRQACHGAGASHPLGGGDAEQPQGGGDRALRVAGRGRGASASTPSPSAPTTWQSR